MPRDHLASVERSGKQERTKTAGRSWWSDVLGCHWNGGMVKLKVEQKANKE